MADEDQVWAYVIISELPLRTLVRRLRGHVDRVCRTTLPGTIFVASEHTATDLTAVLKRKPGHFLILDADTDRGGILPSLLWDFLHSYDERLPCPKCASVLS